MKSHSVKSNARRVARGLCERFSGIDVSEPVPADGGGWWPAVKVAEGCLASAVDPEVSERAVIVTADAPSQLPKAKRASAAAEPAVPVAPPSPSTKGDTVLALIARPDGATADELTKATGWLPHTLRGFMSTQKSKGRAIWSERSGNVTTYRLG